jgi:microcystin-dependent protein
MAEPFVGEIRMFAGNFAPRNWAFCDGQLLTVSQNDALFSLLGTIYGGDGRTTFGLPDMRGRIPIHAGTGPGLSPRSLGSKGGLENVTLTANQLPSHSHATGALSKPGDSGNPQNRLWAATSGSPAFYSADSPDEMMDPNTLTGKGGSQSHSNLMPFLCVHFIIALFGVYPSRN